MTGSMYLVSVLTLPFAALLFLALWLTGWPPAAQVAVGIPVIVLFSAVALSASRGLWAAVEYMTDVRSGETRRPDYEARAFRR